MKTYIRYLPLFLLFFLASGELFGQLGYEFTYDAAGNRVKREYKQVTIKRGVQEEVTHSIAEHEISVFPNPATSYLEVKLGNLSRESKAAISIIDLSGRTIFSREGVGEMTRIDVSKQVNGIYLMQITIDGQVTDWKIVKEE